MSSYRQHLHQEWKNGQWAILKLALGERCLMCGTEEEVLKRSFVQPRSRRGGDAPHNWQPLCARCDTAKGDLWIDFRLTPPIHYDQKEKRLWTPEDTQLLLTSYALHGRRGEKGLDGWQRILLVVGHRCLMCGICDLPLTRDHIVPKTFGGPDSLANAQPLCFPCNNIKGTMALDLRHPQWIDPKTREWKCLSER